MGRVFQPTGLTGGWTLPIHDSAVGRSVVSGQRSQLCITGSSDGLRSGLHGPAPGIPPSVYPCRVEPPLFGMRPPSLALAHTRGPFRCVYPYVSRSRSPCWS